MEYLKEIVRPCSLFDARAWHRGESEELRKWLDFGFDNTIFVSKGGMVCVYYAKSELDRFEKVLDEKLTEELFDEMCNYFLDLIDDSEMHDSEEFIFNISSKCWPILTIFDVLSKYPEYGNEATMRRLMRLEIKTKTFLYDLSDRVGHNKFPKDYVLYRGDIYEKSFEDFISDMGIVILGE